MHIEYLSVYFIKFDFFVYKQILENNNLPEKIIPYISFNWVNFCYKEKAFYNNSNMIIVDYKR